MNAEEVRLSKEYNRICKIKNERIIELAFGRDESREKCDALAAKCERYREALDWFLRENPNDVKDRWEYKRGQRECMICHKHYGERYPRTVTTCTNPLCPAVRTRAMLAGEEPDA